MGIPTVLDRLIQQAVLEVLQKRWDPTFSKHSYGFRPRRSAHQAVAQAQAYIAEGYQWVVDIDLGKLFDRVNHDLLMARVAKRVADKRLLQLIRAFLTAGVMEDGLVSPADEGTPQGGPLSPLLSNLVLDDLDRELERRSHRFCRYADDCTIYVRSRRAGERVMASVCKFLTKKLRLKVNESKSAVARPDERKFLGFRLTTGAEPRAIDIAGGVAKVPGASARVDEQDPRDQHRANDRFAEAVCARLAKLFWFQTGPVGASQPGCTDPPETPYGDLAAVGEGADSIRQLTAIGCASHASGRGRWLPDWLVGDVATRGCPASAAQCLFRLARSAQTVSIFERLTPPNRRGTDPYAQWCDRESPRGPTYVDQQAFPPANRFKAMVTQ